MWEGIGVTMDAIKRDVGECDALNKSKIRDNKYKTMKCQDEKLSTFRIKSI